MVRIGLIGTGKIGSAVMAGYASDNGWQPSSITVSNRTLSKANALKELNPTLVTIEPDNQKIIDASDIIFIGLLPNVAKQQLPTLDFKGKSVISMMATISYDELLRILPNATGNVIRTVPLPSASTRTGPILAYPENELTSYLDYIGTAVVLKTEEEMTVLTGMTAMISFFYATCDEFHQWNVNKGVESKASRDFISSFFASLANAGAASTESFRDMAIEAATPGGLNEQTNAGLQKTGAYSLMSDQLDIIYNRLTNK